MEGSGHLPENNHLNKLHQIQIISHTDVVPLRHKILRQGRPVETCFFPNDSAVDTRHYGAVVDNKLVSIASVYRADFPGVAHGRAWQIRGMATEQAHRQQGLATSLLQASIDYAQTQAGIFVWCNARIEAVGVYERIGFERIGEPFDIPEIGAHYRMGLDLANGTQF